MPLDGLRHQLLAGAAFAPNQDVDVFRRYLADRLIDLLHGRAVPQEQIAGYRPRPDVFPVGLRVCNMLADSDGLFDQFANSGERQRFDCIIEHSPLDGLDRRGCRAVRREKDHRRARFAVTDALQKFQARPVGTVAGQNHHFRTVAFE